MATFRDSPLAYLITWSCYGARLHGDDRGTVDHLHNIPDTPLLPASHARLKLNAHQMAEEALELSDRERAVVEQAIRDHCKIRCWPLQALNIRTNHVHLVAGAATKPETMMGQFKAWSSRRLRESGLAREKIWTPHGSTKYLWDERAIVEAVQYVLNQ
ncbi:MAG: transposase [Phycisphaerales bacterium]|nr:transposase [Phycisphaerales bacterium]